MAILFYGAFRLDRTLLSAYRAIFIATLIAVLLSVAASETLVSALLIQLQLWRVLWLTQFFALIAITLLVWNTIQKKHDYLPLLGFTAALFYLESIGGYIAVIVTALSLLESRITLQRKWMLLVLSLLLLMGGFEFIALEFIYVSKTLPLQLSQLSSGIDARSIANNYIAYSTVISIALLSIYTASARPRNRALKILSVIGAATVCIISIFYWDTRSDERLMFNDNNTEANRLTAMIKPNETLYCSDSPQMAWFVLGRSSYYSIAQTAGTIFNRNTAVEAFIRHTNLDPLYTGDDSRTMYHGQEKDEETLTSSDISAVCQDQKLDWLCLRHPHPGYRAIYTYADEQKKYFYSCNDFRLGAEKISGW